MALTTPAISASVPTESSAVRWKYEVFLSFRGADTRKGITSKLYNKLQNMKGIQTFMDDLEIEPGDAISHKLLTAIKESRFAIIILSPDYASSTWCLRELATIFHYMGGANTNRILPLFYQVDPSDVRHQKGSFEAAFKRHISKQGIEKVEQWRSALEKVADLSGWDSKNFPSDKELVEDIVKLVWSKVLQVRNETESRTKDFEVFASTQIIMDEVTKALENDLVTVVGVYGMGGVGKTTMVQHVAAEVRKTGLFDKVITIVASQNPDVKKIQSIIAEMLALPLKVETEEGRADIMNAGIMRRGKILFILDDVWKSIKLSSIGIPDSSELKLCNSKIVLTTRKMNICYIMGSEKVINLSILSVKDSLTLFVKKARISSDESTEIYKVARKVARKCGGLPVALIAVARALGDKDLHEWERAARRLRVSQPANPEDETNVFDCIKLSYDHLRSSDVKSCFLLCCLFPEDYVILIEDLFKYGLAIGLFQDSDTMQDARDRAEEVVESLIASNLLLSSKGKRCVKMHDVVREVAILITSDGAEQFFVNASCELKQWPKFNALKNYSAISLMKNAIPKLPANSVCSKLKILLLQHNANLHEIQDTFFESSNELRVLNLSETSICSLPVSIYFPTNLHSLYLDGCKSIGDMSFLGKLNSLELLSMRRCCPEEFPKEIRDLTKLRMLDITGFGVSTIPYKVISELSRLEELYMVCDFADWGSIVVPERAGEIAHNIGFDELTTLSDLKVLNVLIYNVECLPKYLDSDPNWLTFDICIGRQFSLYRQDPIKNSHSVQFTMDYQASRMLTIDTTMTTLPDWFINVVVARSEFLCYFECRDLTNIVEEYDLGRLHALKCLYIKGSHKNLEVLIDTTTRGSNTPVFKNLEELHVVFMDGLKQLCFGELPPESLSNLKVLDVDSCHNFCKALISTKLLQTMQNLETVDCWRMQRMEYVFESDEDLEPEHVLKLRILRLSDLENLTTIWCGPAPPLMFRNLRIMAICRCNNLKFVFPFDVAQGLMQLENLSIGRCCNLETLIEPREQDLKNIQKRIISFPNLKSLELIVLPQLTEFCGCDLYIEFPILEYMYESRCPNLQSHHLIINDRVKVNNMRYSRSLNARVWQAARYTEEYNQMAKEMDVEELNPTTVTTQSWQEYCILKSYEVEQSTSLLHDYAKDYLACERMGYQIWAIAIIGHDGEVWSQTATFPRLKREEVSCIVNELNEPGSLASTEFYLGGTEYLLVQGKPGLVISGIKRDGGGVSVKKASPALVIGIHDDTMSHEQCTTIVERLGNYLINRVWGPTLDFTGSEDNDYIANTYDIKGVESSRTTQLWEESSDQEIEWCNVKQSPVLWQDYVTNHLMCESEGFQLSAAAITDLDGNILAQSATFPTLTLEEVICIMNEFNEPGSLALTGFYLGGLKYMHARGKPGAVTRGIKLGGGTVSVMKTSMALVFGIHDVSRTPKRCTEIVESLGDFMIENGL